MRRLANRLDQIPARFGLVQDQWPDIHKMNVAALKNEKFKLLFIARHGEGFRERRVVLKEPLVTNLN